MMQAQTAWNRKKLPPSALRPWMVRLVNAVKGGMSIEAAARHERVSLDSIQKYADEVPAFKVALVEAAGPVKRW